MIKKLSIENFKSVKELDIDCRRVNLFIGEPNTGKSNILEALGLLSWCTYRNTSLKEYVRFEYMANLFFDNSADKPIKIAMMKRKSDSPTLDDAVETKITFRSEGLNFDISLNHSRFGGVDVDPSGGLRGTGGQPERELWFVKYYIFEKQDSFQGTESAFLIPPHGSNMFSVVSRSKRFRESITAFFRTFGFKLMLRTQEKKFEFLKEVEDTLFSYPYVLASDTLKRMIFYTIAIESNENSTLVFEEPEAHAFPDYTYNLGKKIAFDEKNQYFIATHNPYLFLSILEKTPKDDVNVLITYYEDYQTKVKCLNDEEKSKIMVYDPFANLDCFIGSLDSFVEEEEQ